ALNWNAQAPVNDDFTNAINLGNAAAGSASGTDINATMETNETPIVNTSDNGPIAVENSIWYQWRAPQNGDVTFNTFGSMDELGNPQDTVVAVWTGNSVTNLVFVGADDNVGNNAATNQNSSMEFVATAGQTYDIAVYVNGQNGGLPGAVVLDWAVQATNTPASGTFQFTSAAYQFSQNEEDAPLHSDMRATAGPRVTITRIGGADGMADVSYYFTNTWYTNWTTTVTYETNSMSYFYNTNGSLAYTTNGVTTVFNTTQVYQNYDVQDPLNPYEAALAGGPEGFFNVTNLSSALLEQSFSNGVLTSFLFTNGLPFITNLSILQAPNIAYYTNTVINTNNTLASLLPYEILTNEFWISNSIPLPTNSATGPNGPLIVDSTNFLYYTNLTATNVLSTYLGASFPQGPETAVFNDYQMNYDILFPFGFNELTANLANPLALLVMTGASLDPNEDPYLPVPQISPTRAVAYVSLYNDYAIPPQFGINGYNALTNNVFNFERSTLRCDKTVNNDAGGIAYVGVTCPHHTDQTSAEVYWRIDDDLPRLNIDNANDWFTTQAGSDYARPDNPGNGIYAASTDFMNSAASPDPLAWGAYDNTTKFIAIPINQDSEVKFNRDISIELYYPVNVTPQTMDGYIGNISTCTLTILMTTPPAGAVDTSYMAENNQVSGDPNDSDPGANGQVNAVVVQTNGYAVIGGQFNSVNAVSGGSVGYIARLDTTGVLDPAFNPGV
ncbi:MAG: delta-60 repeat domain-containing protein, partial [Limisphaerales bacterium]